MDTTPRGEAIGYIVSDLTRFYSEGGPDEDRIDWIAEQLYAAGLTVLTATDGELDRLARGEPL